MKRNKGYTLVELLISLAIFGIISISIGLIMRNAAVSYKNESIEVNIQKEAQIFLTQMEDLICDSTSKIIDESDSSTNKYKITNPDGVFTVSWVKNSDKIYLNDSYLMAEIVKNFQIDFGTGNEAKDNACVVSTKFAYNNGALEKYYDANKKIFFRNYVENSEGHQLDLSTVISSGTPGGSANTREIKRYEIVNLYDEFGMYYVDQIDSNYKCLDMSSSNFDSTYNKITKPVYTDGKTYMITTNTNLLDDPTKSVQDKTVKGRKKDGTTSVEVVLSTKSVKLEKGTGQVIYPAGDVNVATNSNNLLVGYFNSDMTLTGFDCVAYNKYWNASNSTSYPTLKYDMKLKKNGQVIKKDYMDNNAGAAKCEMTGVSLKRYLQYGSIGDSEKMGWAKYQNTNGVSMNQSKKFVLVSDDYCNDCLAVMFDNSGQLNETNIFNDGALKVEIKLYFTKSNGTYYSNSDMQQTYTMVTSGTPLSAVN